MLLPFLKLGLPFETYLFSTLMAAAYWNVMDLSSFIFPMLSPVIDLLLILLTLIPAYSDMMMLEGEPASYFSLIIMFWLLSWSFCCLPTESVTVLLRRWLRLDSSVCLFRISLDDGVCGLFGWLSMKLLSLFLNKNGVRVNHYSQMLWRKMSYIFE